MAKKLMVSTRDFMECWSWRGGPDLPLVTTRKHPRPITLSLCAFSFFSSFVR